MVRGWVRVRGRGRVRAAALDVVREVGMDHAVDLEGELVVARPSVAGGHHQLPLDLLRLDLRFLTSVV